MLHPTLTPLFSICVLFSSDCSWHGWMHHMFDETPEEYQYSKNKEIAQLSHANAVCNTHVYEVPEGAVVNEELYNLSQYRYSVAAML